MAAAHGQVLTPSWAGAQGAARRRAGRLGGAAADRDRGLDGLGHQLGGPGRGQRAEVGAAVGGDGAHHREPREALVGELEVGVAPPGGGLAVEAGLQLVDQADLADGRLEGAGAHDVVDALGLAEQLADLLALVAGEVGAHTGPEVGRLADVQDPAGPVSEEVDARPAGQVLGQAELRRLRVAAELGQGQQVVEAEHPEAGGALEQHVEQVGGGQGVVESPVARPVGQAQLGGEGAEPAVADLVAHQPAGEGAGVDPAVVERGALVARQRRSQEGEVVAHVVADDHARPDELEQGRQHGLDARRRRHHDVGDAGEHGDGRRDGGTRVDQGLEGAEPLAGAHLDRADLGDAPVGRRAAGRLEVDHAEGDLVQRRAQVVEAALAGEHRRHGSEQVYDEQVIAFAAGRRDGGR